MRNLRHKGNGRSKRSGGGFAIVMVLFVISLLLVLGAAMTMTAVTNSQNTVGADGRERAYNTAESGVADVLTALGNGTIGPSSNATWVNGNTFPSQQDSAASYNYNVTFNNTPAAIAAADPLTSTGGACGSVSSPGFGCVAIPPNGVLIAVRGYYGTRQVATEAEAVSNDFQLNGNTLLTKGDAGTNGNGNIASDPCSEADGCPNGVPASHNVKAFTDGNFNGGKGLIDGNVSSVGTATATIPSGCTPSPCVAKSGATAIPFPASNNLVQDENLWKAMAISKGHYYGPNATLPSSITVNQNDTYFVDQSVDLKNVSITNQGGLIVVTGSVSESGNKSAANYSLSDSCNTTCSCHSQAQLIVLSTNGISIHGQGTGKGHLVSQGVLFAPNGPAANIGNASMQAAIVAASAQIGGTASMTADTCAATAHITMPGYNITGYGEH
jgi:hypothetical protein